jgi:hypothetical protein
MKWLPFVPSELHASWRGARGDGGGAHHEETWPTQPTRWGSEEPMAIDVSLLHIVYGLLAAETRCSRCGAPLGRGLRVEVWPTLVRSVQWRVRVRTSCRGWRRHRHAAAVGLSSSDLLLGPFGLSRRDAMRERGAGRV